MNLRLRSTDRPQILRDVVICNLKECHVHLQFHYSTSGSVYENNLQMSSTMTWRVESILLCKSKATIFNLFSVQKKFFTHSVSWLPLCSSLLPHHCWLCICRVRHCPWSNSSVPQSLGFWNLMYQEWQDSI